MSEKMREALVKAREIIAGEGIYPVTLARIDDALNSQQEVMPEGVNGTPPAEREGWKPTHAEVLAWNDRNGGWFQGRLDEARCAIDDARSMHQLSAPPQQQEQKHGSAGSNGEAWAWANAFVMELIENNDWMGTGSVESGERDKKAALAKWAAILSDTSPATPTATASQEADEDAPFTLDDAIAHANGLEHQVKMLTRQRDGLELIARMVAGALEKAGFKADEVDNPADAIELLHTRLMAATASQESAPGQEAVAIGWAVPISGEYQFFRSYDQAARERREYCDSTGEEFVAPRQCYLAPPTSTAIAAMVIKKVADGCREEAVLNRGIRDQGTDRDHYYFFEGQAVACEELARWVDTLTPANAEAELEALMMKVAIVRRVLDEMKGAK